MLLNKMLRSGLVNQHRARFEEGFPHERNNHPRDALERPYVQQASYPILKKGDYAQPELPADDPNPIQTKYIDLFGKKTTADERLYLYREFFRAAKKFGAIPGQPTGPSNANGRPGNMPPPPGPQNPPAAPGEQPPPEGQPPGDQTPPDVPGQPPTAPGSSVPPLMRGSAPSSSGASSYQTAPGVEYISELDAQVFTDAVGGNIGRGYDHESEVNATEAWVNGMLDRHRNTRWRSSRSNITEAPSVPGAGLSTFGAGLSTFTPSGAPPSEPQRVYPSVPASEPQGLYPSVPGSEPQGLYPSVPEQTARAQSEPARRSRSDILFTTTDPLGPVVNGNVTSAAAQSVGVPLDPELDRALRRNERGLRALRRRFAQELDRLSVGQNDEASLSNSTNIGSYVPSYGTTPAERGNRAHRALLASMLNNPDQFSDMAPDEVQRAYLQSLVGSGLLNEARDYVQRHNLQGDLTVLDPVARGVLTNTSGSTRGSRSAVSQAESVNRLGSAHSRARTRPGSVASNRSPTVSLSSSSPSDRTGRLARDLRNALPSSDDMRVDQRSAAASRRPSDMSWVSNPRRTRRTQRVNYREASTSASSRSTTSYRP